MRTNWYSKRFMALKKLKVITSALIDRTEVVKEWKMMIYSDMTALDISKITGVSVSALQQDYKRFGRKKRWRKDVKASGCCVEGYQARIADERGSREWRRLGNSV